jgi:hypothetical protein
MIKNKLESLSGSKFKAYKVGGLSDGATKTKGTKIILGSPMLTDIYTDKCHEYDAYDSDTNPGGDASSGKDWWWVDTWGDISR